MVIFLSVYFKKKRQLKANLILKIIWISSYYPLHIAIHFLSFRKLMVLEFHDLIFF